MTDVTWVLPAAYAAVENTKAIAGMWSRLNTSLLRKKSRIVVAGLPGVGKTVLVDHVNGKADSRHYYPPGRSTTAEKSTVDGHEGRFAVTVLPAQASKGENAVQRHLAEGKGVDGVVYVVSNGFIHDREPFTPDVLRDFGIADLEAFREYNRKREIAHVEEVSRYLRDLLERDRRPRWMLIAVTKVDLYCDELSAARAHYSPSESGEFGAAITRLQHDVGRVNLSVLATPVCGWLDDYRFNGTVVRSSLKPMERNRYLVQFLSLLEELSNASRS